MNILVDMNLSPAWVQALADAGWDAIHWSSVGDPRAPDTVIMDWARAAGHVVFTHDLDFGTLLALTRARGPSVVQVRTQDVLPGRLATVVVAAMTAHRAVLEVGALLTIDETSTRVRVLPVFDQPDGS